MNKSFEAQPMQITADNLSNGGIHLVSRMKNKFAWKNTVIDGESQLFHCFMTKGAKEGIIVKT